MKYLGLSLIFLGWCMVTAIAGISIFGVLILADDTNWFEFPGKIIEKF